MTLSRFVLGRLLQALVSLLVVLALVFVIVRTMGDPTASRLGINATEEDRQSLREAYGLDDPIPLQYANYVGRAVTGDFGSSITYSRPVWEVLSARLPPTLKLAATANLLSIVVALPLGVLAALRRGRIADLVVRLSSTAGQSLPPFWIGLLLISLFALNLGWFPTGGMNDGWKSYVLPAVTMSLFIAPGLIRITRSAMINVLESDHVRFARVLNLPARTVVWRFAFGAAAVPIVTYASLIALATLTGAVITESVFSWPGVGGLAVQSVFNRDFAVVESIVVLATGTYLLVNLLLDVAYGFLDPRIRFGGGA